jgi:hypothetical protein
MGEAAETLQTLPRFRRAGFVDCAAAFYLTAARAILSDDEQKSSSIGSEAFGHADEAAKNPQWPHALGSVDAHVTFVRRGRIADIEIAGTIER